MKDKLFSRLEEVLTYIKEFYSAHRKLAVAIGVLIIIALAISPSFFRKPQRSLLPEDLFSITYDEEDKGYVVRLNGKETPETKDTLAEWLKKQNVDTSKTKVRYLTVEDQGLQKKIIGLLPLNTEEFSIQYFPKTDIFLVQIKKEPFSTYQQIAIAWFQEQGIKDLAKIKIRWLKEGPGMSDEL